jgi:hypothetical protein
MRVLRRTVSISTAAFLHAKTLLAAGPSRVYSRPHGRRRRPAVLIAWVECESCERIDKAAHDLSYLADIAEEMQLLVWLPCERCGRLAKLHMKREIRPAH